MGKESAGLVLGKSGFLSPQAGRSLASEREEKADLLGSE
jgi:hypothetical protein